MRYNNIQKEAIINAYLALPVVTYMELNEGSYTKDPFLSNITGELNFYLGECKAIDYGEDGVCALVFRNGSITSDYLIEEYTLNDALSETLTKLFRGKPNNTSEENYKRFATFCLKTLTTAKLLDMPREEESLLADSSEEVLEVIFIDGALELTEEQEDKIRTAYMNLGTIDANNKIHEKELSKNNSGVKFFEFLLFSGICNSIIGTNGKLWCLTGYSRVDIRDRRKEDVIPEASEAINKILVEGSACCGEANYKLFATFCANVLYEEILDKKEPSEELNLALDYIKDLDKFEEYKYYVGCTERHKVLNMIKSHKSKVSTTATMNKMGIF